MPILFNENNIPETLSLEKANQALERGTHTRPIVSPEGDIRSVSHMEFPKYLEEGYRDLNPEELEGLATEAKYSTDRSQLKAGLEGAAEAATFGLSTPLEIAAGVKPEDIRGRRAFNPGSHSIGEVVGLAGSAFLPNPLSAAKALSAAENLVAKSVIGTAERALPKIGSAAVKGATGMALLQAGDEASKYFSQDPESSMEQALSNIGMSAALGGVGGAAFGTVANWWEKRHSSALGKLLGRIKNRVNGEKIPELQMTQELQQAAGVTIPSEIRAAMSGDPVLENMYKGLVESQTKTGIETTARKAQLREDLKQGVFQSLSKTPEAVADLTNLSKREQGSDLKGLLSDEVKDTFIPISQKFSNMKEQFSKVVLPGEMKNLITNRLAEINLKPSVTPSLPSFSKINTIIEELGNVGTLEDFRTFQTAHLNDLYKNQLWDIYKPVKETFRAAEEETILEHLSQNSPHLVDEARLARALYSDSMGTLEDLNERLRVGNFQGPETFLHKLNDLTPEKFLDRILQTKDASFLQLIQDRFPRLIPSLRESYLNRLLESEAVKGEAKINVGNILKKIRGLSPELRNFILPEGAERRLEAIQEIMDKVPGLGNPPHTAGQKDYFEKHWPGAAMAAVHLLMGKNPAQGYILGQMSRYLAREAPDAAKISLLKFLGTEGPIESQAFKSTFDLTDRALRGYKEHADVIKALVSGSGHITQDFFSNQSELSDLKDKLKKVRDNPHELMSVGGDSGYYIPEHQTAYASSISRAAGYVDSKRPNESKPGILDKENEPSAIAEYAYDRTLSIANKPLTVFKFIEKGNLTPEDVNDLKAMYPHFYKTSVKMITDEIIEQEVEEKSIPYGLRLNLSLFLGTPLDYSMTQEGLAGTQAVPADSPKPKVSRSQSKIPKLTQTPLEQAQGSL